MFDSDLDEEVASVGVPVGEDWFDPAWLNQAPAPEDTGQVPMAQCAPSGWLALELDHGTVDPERLSDAELIDTVAGFERVAVWAGARQAALLAEFAHRRPDDYSQPTRSDVPLRCSEFASDEIGLALRLSRTTATQPIGDGAGVGSRSARDVGGVGGRTARCAEGAGDHRDQLPTDE
jgi:hypothetical protein